MKPHFQRLIAALSGTLLLLAEQAAHAVETVAVIENYNRSLGAHFIASRSAEQTLLDNAAGFSRSGRNVESNAHLPLPCFKHIALRQPALLRRGAG